ncbi:MAG: ATP-grasp domain-containing protein [Gemmataceae bacterium]
MAHHPELPSLVNEGKTMFLALAKDLATIPGFQVITSIDRRVVGPGELPASVSWEPAVPSPEGDQFRSLASRCDIALVIAPEVGMALSKTAEWLRQAGCRSMGPSPDVLRNAGNKSVMARIWDENNVPSIPTRFWRKGDVLPAPRSVVKLACGAGSWGNRVVGSIQEADAVLDWAESHGLGEVLVQPLLAGFPLSVAALVGPSQSVWLEPCAQFLSNDGGLGYRGGEVPLDAGLRSRALCLGRRALACWPGLRGWTGLDMLMGAAQDGSEDRVVELNPRCTTSYSGLRKLARTNLAQAWYETIQGGNPVVEWGNWRVRWTNQGKAEVIP